MPLRGGGVILNLIGHAGERLRSQNIIGSTDNAALMAFTCSLGSQSPASRALVLGVNLGMTATERGEQMHKGCSQYPFGTPDSCRELQAGIDLPFGRMATPQEVAGVVVFMVLGRIHGFYESLV